VGDQVDPEQIGPVPSNAIIVKQAPQLDLLKQTSAAGLKCCVGLVRRFLEKGYNVVGISRAISASQT
jgi:hypothetical protein